VNDRYGPPPAIIGDELTIIGRALQEHLSGEIERTIHLHRMFDETVAKGEWTEQEMQNGADSKERDWAWIARIDELRHKYIVEPMISVENYREHLERRQQEGSAT
jgi:hypothetical protein